MRVASIQMVSGKHIDANLIRAEALLREAAAAGAQLAVLPENFACYGRGNLRREAEAESSGDGPLLPFLQEQAQRLNLWLVGGTIPLVHAADTGDAADAERAFAASCVFDAAGELRGRYDKSHLFDAQVADQVGGYCESQYICPGRQPVVVTTPWAKLGLSVCYDLRFPEYFRLLRAQGADILIVPAAFTYTTGSAHWEVLLRARAIENQCFVIAAGQGGQHDPKRQTYGHSMVVHPWGQVMAQQPEGEAVVLADIDLEEVYELRRRMPVASHRRF